jgi:dienelactone hydrolase
MTTQDLEYTEGGKTLRGYLAFNESREARPGVLVLHENTGLTDHERGRARRLGELGYVALACDLFGERTAAPSSPEEQRKAFEEFRDKKLVPRTQAGLEALLSLPQVDRTRVAAIGFCMGGMAALELARSGADLKGVASFHGGLSTTRPAVAGQVKAKVLVCHGALDPFITLEHVTAFTKEMQGASVDYQVILYGGAMHGFTNPAVDRFGRPGIAYHQPSDLRSWGAGQAFLSELFTA